MAGRAAERSGLLRGAPRSPLHPARAPEAEEKRKLGNQAVLRRMQAKLEVSSPGDAHEREADRIADAVVAQRKAEGPTPKRPDEPKRLQRKAEEPKPKKLDEPKVQRQEDGPAHAAPDAEAIVQAAQGQGSALAPSERAFFEPQLSSDLGGVRLHTGAAAQQAAAQLNAKAFTVGQDIFFAAGRHQPGTAEGRHLLAHELAHTLQQQPGGAARAHRAESLSPKDKAAKADPAKFTKQQGQLVGDTIVFDSVALPKFKAESPRGDLYAAKATLGKLRHAKDYDRKKAAPEPQREKWRRLVGKDTTAAEAALRDLTKGDDKETYLFKPKRGSQSFVGTVAEVAKDMVTPAWDHRGEHRFYDVDHIVELQLGGENELDNMELLDSSINRSSGSLIRNAILDKAQLFVDAMGGDVSHGANAEAVKEKHDLAFDGVVAGKDVEAKEGDFWTADQIQKAAHINKDMVEAIPLDKVGGKGKVIVFTKKSGGFATTFPKDGTVPDTRLVKPFSIDSATWATGKDADPMGTVFFSIPDNHATYFPAKGKADVKRLEGTGKAGLIDAKAVREQAEALHRRKSSPIEIDSFDLTPDGLAAEGNIVLTLPFAKGAKVPFRMLGDDVTFAKTFEADELKGIPPPFKVTGAFLTISASTADPHFAIAGQVDVEIAGLGKGMLAADASLRGFNVEGTFAFDSALFEPADIALRYRDGAFSGEGELGIPEGKVRGLKGAQVSVAYADGKFTAAGAAQPAIPGVKEAALTVEHSEKEGLLIGGKLELADLPGIKGGSIDAAVRRGKDGRYSVHASGTAKPDIPGIAATLAVTYDDGAFDIAGSADYARPRVTGVVKVGVTNRRLDKKGLPAGKPGDTLRAYGGGSVELTLSPKLKGKVGLQLLPNGEVEIEGELRPAPLTLFKEIAWPSKQIGPTLHFEIPIFGVSALGYSFGIFATIGGKVSLNAGVGPGEVNNLVASVKYNPAHPERTTLAGSAGLHIPAHAGVRLAVFCGIGAGLAIADVVAGIEVGGELGMKAALDAGLDVAWSPQGGLVVDATASAYAQPSFTLDVKGYVDVNLLKTNVYHTDMDLARFEFGSALRLGLLVPIHYEENKPFALAFDKVQFTVPDLNPKAALDAAVTKAADGGKKE